MKTITFILLASLLSIGCASLAQNYPTSPSLATISADIKKDPKALELMKSYGYDPADLTKGRFRMAVKSELRDYFKVKWYWRSDKAYNISQNKNYCDMHSFALFLVTPKDAKGVYHEIFFKVDYDRKTPQNFEDTKWNYDWLVLDPRENKSHGLPKVTDAQRKKMMMDYILENKQDDENISGDYNILNRIVKIDSILAPSHSVRYFKPMGANSFLWTLVIKGEYAQDLNSELGVERIDKGYYKIPFKATYSNGSYKIANAMYNTEHHDTWMPGHKALHEAGNIQTRFDPPKYFGSLRTEGFDGIMGKMVEKPMPINTKTFLELRAEEMEETFKGFDPNNVEAFRAKLETLMDPANAKKLADSYITEIKGWQKKLCKVKGYANAQLGYRWKDEGQIILNIKFFISREKASTKEMQQKYKAAGMSKSVLKSTSRGSEYGAIGSKSYKADVVVKRLDDNWYIMDAAEPDKVKVAF